MNWETGCRCDCNPHCGCVCHEKPIQQTVEVSAEQPAPERPPESLRAFMSGHSNSSLRIQDWGNLWRDYALSLEKEVTRLDFLHKLDHSLADQWQAKNEALKCNLQAEIRDVSIPALQLVVKLKQQLTDAQAKITKLHGSGERLMRAYLEDDDKINSLLIQLQDAQAANDGEYDKGIEATVQLVHNHTLSHYLLGEIRKLKRRKEPGNG